MVNFLKTVIDVLPESQKIAIKSLIANKSKTIPMSSARLRQDEAALIFNRIKTRLGSMLLNPKYAVKGQKISSSDYNENMEEIFLDLNALYEGITSSAYVLDKQIVTLDSDYEKSRATIEKLINDVKVYSLKSRNPEFNEVKLIDFNSSSNTTNRSPSASVNSNTRLLELKPLSISRKHLINRSNKTTKIYTKTYGNGLKGGLSTMFPPENIADQRVESFWGSIVLADSPISQVYETKSTSLNANIVNIDGPIVEIYFKFSHIEKVNTIKVLPFSEFPVKIVDISYRPNNAAQVFISIDDFTQSTTLDWEEYNFKFIHCSEIRITIAQENYKKLSYLLPKSVITNTDIFQTILKQRSAARINAEVSDSDFSLYVINSITTYQNAIDSLQELYKNYGLDITIQPNIEYYNNFDKLLKLIYSEFSTEQIQNLSSTLLSNEPLQQPDNGLITITKYEYLLGIREIEINYQYYCPYGFYESEKFVPQATVSEVQIEVDERHVLLPTEWQNDYRKTSTEWEVDIGNNRTLPIHPINIIDDLDNVPTAKDERLNFDILTRKAYTRLGGKFSFPYRLKKNSILVPSTEYSSVRISESSIPKIEITLTGEWFDPNSIYTIDYAVDRESYTIPILDRFDSEYTTTPEVFKEVKSNNEVELQKFPYINYEIINLTGYFTKQPEESIWNFTAPQANITTGLARVIPTIVDNLGSVVQVGSITGFLISGNWGNQSGQLPPVLTGNPNLSNIYFGEIQGVQFGYFIKIMNSANYGEIDSFYTGNGFLLKTPITVTEDQCRAWDSIASGYVFSGSLASPISGTLNVEYSIGVGIKSDGKVYSLDQISYSPMKIKVGGREAKNITNYETLVHPAFSSSRARANNIEYIQAGKLIYFNQKIENKDIEVEYNWLMDYIRILGTLRFNGLNNPDLTPKVNEVRVYLNNLVI